MSEYNFWDDRTYDENEDDFCPIKNDYCFADDKDCENCDDYKELLKSFPLIKEE